MLLMTYRKDMGMARQFNEENEHVVCIKIPSKSQPLEILEGLWIFLYFSNNYEKKKALTSVMKRINKS